MTTSLSDHMEMLIKQAHDERRAKTAAAEAAELDSTAGDLQEIALAGELRKLASAVRTEEYSPSIADLSNLLQKLQSGA